jgi:hypothetical protein
MAQTTVGSDVFRPRSGGRTKFLIGGALIIAAIVYLIVTSLQSTAQYFYTITELQSKGASLAGKNVRASGAVLGSSITYDPKSLTITFEMANVSNDAKVLDAAGGLAEALHNAVIDPNGARIKVVTKSGAQYNHVTYSCGYASSSAGPVHFGLGANASADLVEIRWPSGIVQTLKDVAADRVMQVKEPPK